MTKDLRDIEPFNWQWADCPDDKPTSYDIGGTTKSGDVLKTAVREALQNAIDHPLEDGGVQRRVDVCFIKSGQGAQSVQERKLVRLLDNAFFKNKDLTRTDKDATGYLLIRDYGSGIQRDWQQIKKLYLGLDEERAVEDKIEKLGGRGIGRTAFLHLSSRSAYAMVSWPKSGGGEESFTLGHAINGTKPKEKVPVVYAARRKILPDMESEEIQKRWVRNYIYCAKSLTEHARRLVDTRLIEMFNNEPGCLVVIPIAGTKNVIQRVKQQCFENFAVRILRHELTVRVYDGLDATANNITTISKYEVMRRKPVKHIPARRSARFLPCFYYLEDGKFDIAPGVKESLTKLKAGGEKFEFLIEVRLKRQNGGYKRESPDLIERNKYVGKFGYLEVYIGDEDLEGESSYIVWRRGMAIIRRTILRRDIALVIQDSVLNSIVGSLETSKHDALSVNNLGHMQAEGLYRFVNDVPGVNIEKYGEVTEVLKKLIKLIEELPRLISNELDPPEESNGYFEGKIPGGGGGGKRVVEFTFSMEDGIVRAFVNEKVKFSKGDQFTTRFSIDACRGTSLTEQHVETLESIDVRTNVDWLEEIARRDTTKGAEVMYQCRTNQFANGTQASQHLLTISRFADVTPDVEMSIIRTLGMN